MDDHQVAQVEPDAVRLPRHVRDQLRTECPRRAFRPLLRLGGAEFIQPPGMPEFLLRSPVFGSADPALHTPLTGFELTGQSAKSNDAHANLQVTLMRHTATAQLAADIDIDESSGIKHGLEVIRNAVFNQRTNPYLIHEFLLAADRREHTLDPGYGFLFA